MSVYLSIRGQGAERKAHVCDTLTGHELQIVGHECEDILLGLVRFLVGPDSRLPYQVRAMVRREQTKAIKDGAR